MCDGTQGTPDLRTKFVLGSGLSFAVGNEGGVLTHSHNFTGDGHIHSFKAGDNHPGAYGHHINLRSTPATGTTGAFSSLPPLYALAYIMRL